MFHVEHLHISKKYSTFAVTFIFVFVFGAAGVEKFPPFFKEKKKHVQDNENRGASAAGCRRKGYIQAGGYGSAKLADVVVRCARGEYTMQSVLYRFRNTLFIHIKKGRV